MQYSENIATQCSQTCIHHFSFYEDSTTPQSLLKREHPLTLWRQTVLMRLMALILRTLHCTPATAAVGSSSSYRD